MRHIIRHYDLIQHFYVCMYLLASSPGHSQFFNVTRTHALECNFLWTSFTNHVAYDACACQSCSGSTDVLYLLQQPRSIRRMRIRLPNPRGKHRMLLFNRRPLPTPRFPFAKHFALRMSERRKLQARLRKRRQKSSVPADVRWEEARYHQ